MGEIRLIRECVLRGMACLEVSEVRLVGGYVVGAVVCLVGE